MSAIGRQRVDSKPRKHQRVRRGTVLTLALPVDRLPGDSAMVDQGVSDRHGRWVSQQVDVWPFNGEHLVRPHAGKEIWQIEQACGTNDEGTYSQRIYNRIHRIPNQLGNLALVKHEGFKSEQEWRITIPEHFPSTSASLHSALLQLKGMPKIAVDLPLETVDVQFKEGGPALFKSYTALAFERSALVQVVLGPNVNAELATPVIRRLLDRHGFRHTTIDPSTQPYRT